MIALLQQNSTLERVYMCSCIRNENYKQLVNTLEDSIREHGTPTHLLGDYSNTIVSSQMLDILHAFCIGQWTSKP